MAATYRVDVFHGATPTSGAWPAGGLFHRSDTDPTSIGSSSPVLVPSVGSNYSWVKWFKLNVTSAPVGSVSNLRWFSDGASMGAGVSMLVALKTVYFNPSSVDENSQLPDSSDASVYTSGSPLVVNGGTVLTGAPGFGFQNFVAMQMRVGVTAAPGATIVRVYSYRVDET